VRNFVLIAVYLALGFGLRRAGLVGDRGAKAVNRYIINIALPATAFVGLRAVALDASVAVPISMAWLLFALGAAVFILVGRRLGWPRRTLGAVVLSASLANTSFLGFPLLNALLGPEAIPIGVIADQFGSFLVLATVASVFAAWCAVRDGEREAGADAPTGRNPAAGMALTIGRRLLTYPPLYAVLVALLSRGHSLPQFFERGTAALAATMAPLSLASVGLNLAPRRGGFRRAAVPVALGLAFKLVIAPAALTLFYLAAAAVLGRQAGCVTHVTLLEAAMAPMIMGAVLAIESGQDRDVITGMLLLGIPLSLVTVPMWNVVLTRLLGAG
jgi:predicted permease